ncbi:MAG: helix-turn-helix domain-containing protein [Anaerolineae bacterium]
MPQCPKCHQDTRQVRDGRTPAGSQRFRCKHCGCRHTPQPKDRGYDEDVRLHALQLHLEGVSLRGISRILDINHQTAANWINDYSTYLPADLPDSILDIARLDGLIK